MVLAPLDLRSRPRLAAVVLMGFFACLVPGVARADVASGRIESDTGPVVDHTLVTMPTTDVAPVGSPAGETCPGNSVVGVMSALAGGDWSGQWSNADGWSVERIKGVNIPAGTGRHWVAYVNN